MTYNDEMRNISDLLETAIYFSPLHRSYCGCGGKNVSRKYLMDLLKDNGYFLETTIHAHGIGNNNENKVVKRANMGNGYETEIVIGYFHYTYSMYAKACNFWFEDKDHKTIFNSKNVGIRTYSENE